VDGEEGRGVGSEEESGYVVESRMLRAMNDVVEETRIVVKVVEKSI
jgi:hypothetical protein